MIIQLTLTTILIFLISSIYLGFIYWIAKLMRSQSESLRRSIKGELIVKFLTNSVDFLTQSEFSELMEELAFLSNVKDINGRGVLDEIYKRFPHIEKELKQLLYEIILINHIDKIAKELEMMSRMIKINGVLFNGVIVIIISLVLLDVFKGAVSLTLVGMFIGIMLGILMSILYGLYKYYKSNKILDFVMNRSEGSISFSNELHF
ncbi:MAG: hypothetical protein QXD10_10010 [Metallosphaera sp.]|uniref:hypothetical protein n=1 Tax=Metallosphaera sp. TaxID=2020860 RepID=UPI0031686A95